MCNSSRNIVLRSPKNGGAHKYQKQNRGEAEKEKKTELAQKELRVAVLGRCLGPSLGPSRFTSSGPLNENDLSIKLQVHFDLPIDCNPYHTRYDLKLIYLCSQTNPT